MPWPSLLESHERLPATADLAEGFATLLHQLGNVTPFELAVAGGRRMATPVAGPPRRWWKKRGRASAWPPARRCI